jgi:hypothetical protein
MRLRPCRRAVLQSKSHDIHPEIDSVELIAAVADRLVKLDVAYNVLDGPPRAMQLRSLCADSMGTAIAAFFEVLYPYTIESYGACLSLAPAPITAQVAHPPLHLMQGLHAAVAQAVGACVLSCGRATSSSTQALHWIWGLGSRAPTRPH